MLRTNLISTATSLEEVLAGNNPADSESHLGAVIRTPIVAFAATAVLLLSASSSQAAPGQLDPSFGYHGAVLTPFGDHGGGASGVALQADGKIVVAGWVWTLPGSSFELARYNPDGSLDLSFGHDGLVTTAMDESSGSSSAVAIQPDGKIVVAGGGQKWELARYTTNGSLDRSFGTDGRVSIDPGYGGVDALAIQPDEKIVAAGRGEAPPGSGNAGFLLARFNPNGSLDSTFGENGVVRTPIPDSGATSLVLQSDGKIVAGGYADINRSAVVALARYRPDGRLDPTFGRGGTVTTNLSHNYWGIRLAIQADGKILAGGTRGWGQGIALARYQRNGMLDSSFGLDGLATAQFTSGYDIVTGITVQPDGKILVSVDGADLGQLDAARFVPSGTLDGGFGKGGVVNDITWLHHYVVVTSLAGLVLEPDGNIIVAGDGTFGPYPATGFFVARILGQPNCLVPNLRGKREANAKSTLARYGCSVGIIGHRFSVGVRKGRVVSQDPFPSLVKSEGTPVDFSVSKGRRKRS